ncbi:hypothetical protein MJO28_016515, partial [Puccinia striiformis f. sp. tritici]
MVAGRRSAGSATQGTPTRNMGSGNSTNQSLNPQRSSRVTTPLWSTTLSNKQHSGHQKTKEGNLQTLASASTQHDIAATTDSLASQGQTEAYDYDQDSEVEIEKIESKLCTKKGDEADEDDNFSYVEDCFEPPFWKSGDLPGTALNFNCKWCRMTLTGFVPTKRFECWVLNQILVIWQVRRALPCSRIEDPKLRAAFLYSNKDACLYSQRWSANETKQLYAGLRQQVFKELEVIDQILKDDQESVDGSLLGSRRPSHQKQQNISTQYPQLKKNKQPATPSAQEHELQLFLTANLTFKCEDIADQNFALQWWK